MLIDKLKEYIEDSPQNTNFAFVNQIIEEEMPKELVVHFTQEKAAEPAPSDPGAPAAEKGADTPSTKIEGPSYALSNVKIDKTYQEIEEAFDAEYYVRGILHVTVPGMGEAILPLFFGGKEGPSFAFTNPMASFSFILDSDNQVWEVR